MNGFHLEEPLDHGALRNGNRWPAVGGRKQWPGEGEAAGPAALVQTSWLPRFLAVQEQGMSHSSHLFCYYRQGKSRLGGCVVG